MLRQAFDKLDSQIESRKKGEKISTVISNFFPDQFKDNFPFVVGAKDGRIFSIKFSRERMFEIMGYPKEYYFTFTGPEIAKLH